MDKKPIRDHRGFMTVLDPAGAADSRSDKLGVQ